MAAKTGAEQREQMRAIYSMHNQLSRFVPDESEVIMPRQFGIENRARACEGSLAVGRPEPVKPPRSISGRSRLFHVLVWLGIAIVVALLLAPVMMIVLQ